MILTKSRPTVTVLLGGVFLLIDQLFKYLALNSFDVDYTYRGLIGWKPFLNPGVAFSLPVPQLIVLVFTFPILILLGFTIFRSLLKPKNNPSPYNLAVSLIFFGALSNLIDRLLYQHTVDYVLIYTGVFNLADVMIVLGFVIYIILSTRKKPGDTL
ncbi:MAG TPA: signal peptidase II [Patescibacteria group bacterium]|nr:signal peptidase II [Patescibacteria group bacterium]